MLKMALFSEIAIGAVISGLFLIIHSASCLNHEIKLKNSCQKPITVFNLENGAGKQTASFRLNAGQDISKNQPPSWGGRYYARYQDVAPLAGWPQPDSLFEIKFDAYAGLDFYDISLVDGFGVPLKVELIPGTFTKNAVDPKSCKTIACSKDLVASCPEELKLKQGNRAVACQSSCTKFKSDEFCCTESHNTPQTCPQNRYGKIFKDACPDAYSYAFDDATSTFTCKSAAGKASGYKVTFCG